MVDQKTTNDEAVAAALAYLREMRSRINAQYGSDTRLVNEAITKLEYVRDNPTPPPPPPPRKVKKYVNVYAGGLGQQLFDTAEAGQKAGRRYGWKTFGTYLSTIPVETTIPPR